MGIENESANEIPPTPPIENIYGCDWGGEDVAELEETRSFALGIDVTGTERDASSANPPIHFQLPLPLPLFNVKHLSAF